MLSYEELLEINSPRWLSLEDFPEEEWRDIKGYEGLYMVSNYGRIKSLDRWVSCKRKGSTKEALHLMNGCIIAAATNAMYLYCHLSKNGKKKLVKHHRIVALTFIENIDNLNVINHKNEIKFDNRVVNLEWCSIKYNNNYGTVGIRISKKLRNHPKKSHPVHQYSKHGVFIASYPSIIEASRQTGVVQHAIADCAKKKKRFATAGGYIWSFTKNKKEIKEAVLRLSKPHVSTPVNQLTLDGVFVRTFPSIKQASEETGINVSMIGFCCRHYKGYKQAGGYKWEYANKY